MPDPTTSPPPLGAEATAAAFVPYAVWSPTGTVAEAPRVVQAQVERRRTFGAYRTILADPPWRFQNWSMEERAVRGEEWARRNGRSPYDAMDTDAIAKLPVKEVAAKDSVLLLWATNPKLEDAFAVIKGWGFTYKTMATWVKMSRAAVPRVGLGYRFRACTEHLMLATRGNPPLPPPDGRPLGVHFEEEGAVMFCPIGRHSAKPDYQYDVAKAYEGPYLELFHRPRDGMFPPRPGWRFLGNEVDGLDIRDALAQLAAPDPSARPEDDRQCADPGRGREERL